MRPLVRSLAFLLASAAAVSATGADLSTGPKPEPQALRWRSSVIRIAVSTSVTSSNTSIKADSDVMGAVRRSIAAWHDVSGIDLRLESSDRLNVSPSGAGDGLSLITIAPTSENLQVFARDPFGESARTRVFYDRRGGITEADIVLNPLQQFSTDGTYGTFDLETTLTHEIGHLLGLRHSLMATSMMVERIPRNGELFSGPRALTSSDIAAIRDLYKVDPAADACCGSISGKLSVGSRPGKDLTVWAEDPAGRVMAQVGTDAEGAYRIGGLGDEKYKVLSLGRDASSSAVNEIGSVSLQENDRPNLSKRLSSVSARFALELIGLGNQPSEAAVALRPGRQYGVSISGRGMAGSPPVFTFSTQSIRIDPTSLTSEDLPGDSQLIRFTLTVDSGALPGVYTLYGEKDGVRSAIVGAIAVFR